MKIEAFEYLISEIKSASSLDSKFYKLGLDIQSISDPYHKIISHLLKVYYGEAGEDWISWFLYERSDDGGDQAWDEDGTPICYDVPSLWDCVEKLRVSGDFKEYAPKKELTEEERLQQIKNLFSNNKK